MGKELLKESETVELKKSLAELNQGLISMVNPLVSGRHLRRDGIRTYK